ncbi:FecR family protein [Chitinophaga polysaccharea]|uniref:FecR family protein n=1 Tax=Chitinophaga polysaccharea TaxID=1293035 RepID=A0A561P9W8_9BACT|nr:FecR family protein [Chitinophaga polysaccharea]TWF34931.1 FecR family protein [Chitinophaga polysaccharea]
MEQIIALIQKLKDGTATEAEVMLLESMLEREEDAALRQQWRNEFDRALTTGEQVLSQERTNALLVQLHTRMEASEQHTREQKVIRLRSNIRAYAAAVAGILLLSGMFAMYYTHLQKHAPRPLSSLPTPHLKHIRNTTGKAVIMTLPEGSQVTMDAGAVLSYDEKAARTVALVGKASFNVTASDQHPFTVTAGDITTIALGTRFTVDASALQAVTVKLESGKVLVHHNGSTAKDGIYLLPGEAFHLNPVTHQYAVTKVTGIPEDNAPGGTTVKHAVLLTFTNMPLDKVFKKLAAAYHTDIHFADSEVEGAYFTGQVLKTDSLQHILSAICQLNNLEFTSGDEGITLRKVK